MSTQCENEDNLSSTPFNDTDEPRVQQSIIGFDLAEQGMDTRAIDPYRQGVSIRTAKHRFAGMQPKIGTDSPCHYAKVVTYGQTVSFTQFQDDVKFTDKIGVFDTVGYMNNPIAYEPIIFNDGLQENIEAQMEPLTIPSKMSNMSDSGPYIQRSVHGTLEDGNKSVHLERGNSRIQQFIDYQVSTSREPFLDEGDQYFGSRFMANVADFTNDPFMLYQLSASFSGSSLLHYFNDSVGNGPVMEGSSNMIWEAGPFPTTADNPWALKFTASPSRFLSADPFQIPDPRIAPAITGSMTCESVIYVPTSPTGIKYLVDSDYFTLGINFTAGSLRYIHDGGSIYSFSYGGTLVTGGWNHVAFTRYDSTPGNQRVSMYLNGVFLGESANFAVQTLGAGGDFYIGTFDNTTTNDYEGRISYVKITKSALSLQQLSIEHSRLNNPIISLEGAIKIDGFFTESQNNLSPFNDTTDEEIVVQIQTADSDMLAVLKSLDYDLSEDIRGSFTRKSATAGVSSYGPQAARYGTDSIAYANLVRGS